MSSEDCPCLVAVSLVVGLILLAEQALIGLSAKMRVDWDRTSCQRVEEPEIEMDWDILVPFQNADHNMCHDIVDFQEREAMGEGDTIVEGEVHSEVVGRSQVE